MLSLNGDLIVDVPLGAMIGFTPLGFANGPIVHAGRWPAATAGATARTQANIASLMSVLVWGMQTVWLFCEAESRLYQQRLTSPPVSIPSFTRREFLIAASAIPMLVRFRRGPRPHPTPRPGIDASRVLGPKDLAAYPRARVAFDEVRQIPEIVDGIRCQCGCDEMEGNHSLLSCYEKNGMARECDICQGQGRLAFRLHKAGKSLDEIRAAIDERFG